MVYKKIRNVGHAEVSDVLKGTCYVQEKYDGSFFTFWLDKKGDIVYRSKNNFYDLEDSGMFGKAIDYVSTLELTPGYTYYCEFLSGLRQNVLTYERIPKGHLVLFDIEKESTPRRDNEFINYSVLCEEANRLGLDAVQHISIWLDMYEDVALEKAEQYFTSIKSSLGGSIEGIVIKNYMYSDAPLFAKIVSKQFRERQKQGVPKANFFDDIAEQYATIARFRKALQTLIESGELEGTRADIGLLVKEVQKDTWEEYEKEIVDELVNYYLKKIRNALIQGLPEWYTNEILKH